MIKVLITGALGRMGRTVTKAVEEAEDLEVCGLVEVVEAQEETCAPFFTSLEEAIDAVGPDVMVDFTHPASVPGNVRTALGKGVACVIGTTGMTDQMLAELSATAPDVPFFVAPNFTTGAVLMMAFSKIAAKYFPDAEVIELHHDGKADSPSGTAVLTAKLIAANRAEESSAPGPETELPGMEGARGAQVQGVPVHSVRTAGYVAHQEVIFGSPGQTLTIRHDSIDRASYMPGVLLAIREVQKHPGLTVGLDKLMGL